MTKKTALPSQDYIGNITPGGIKKIKTENRRSDSTYLVDPFQIAQDPDYNVRIRTPDYEAHIEALACNMIEQGYDPAQPISACAVTINGQDVLLVRAGNSRLEAAREAIKRGASFTTIPVVIRPKTDNPVDHIVDLVRSNSARPLNPVELAIVVKRLIKAELTEAEIARQLGFTPSYVNNLVLLASAPPALSMMVAHGEVSAALAFESIRQHGPTEAHRILKEALNKAKASGKGKVTPSRLPGARFAMGVKKAGPRLFQALEVITCDPGYEGLSEQSREEIRALVDELAALKDNDADPDESGSAPPAT